MRWDFAQKLADELVSYVYRNKVSLNVYAEAFLPRDPHALSLCLQDRTYPTTYHPLLDIVSAPGPSTFLGPSIVSNQSMNSFGGILGVHSSKGQMLRERSASTVLIRRWGRQRRRQNCQCRQKESAPSGNLSTCPQLLLLVAFRVQVVPRRNWGTPLL